VDTGVLESDYGLHQIVTELTRERNILDKVFVSRPDIYVASVFAAYLRPSKAVLVHSAKDGCEVAKKTPEAKKSSSL